MTQPIENYIPQDIAVRFHKQAVRVWMTALAVVLLWVTLMLLGPIAAANGFENISTPVYTFFSYICHQIPERSMHIDGHAIAVCSRCFGVYFGILAGLVIYPIWRPPDYLEPPAKFWLFLSLVPISIDWSLTVVGIWDNTHFSRLLTGLILGVACSTFIIPALVEIFRNISQRAETRM